MASQTDLTFITNEEGQSLLKRFEVLIRDTELFDVLVGYFYSSGFYALYKSLERTKQIRILIGIGSDKKIRDRIQLAEEQQDFLLSHTEAKDQFSKELVQEMNKSQDTKEVYEGVMKFMEWLKSGKLKIKAYPSQKLHAKLYIMSFAEGDRDQGRVITGSSNFTKPGLTDNLEFNVELKNSSDHRFALQKFNELWSEAVDVKESYLKTIQKKTWLNSDIAPYELYLKFLYEHFKEDLKSSAESVYPYMPQNFKQFEYQNQAVQNAKRILEEYGGVFLSDVVGLGKTYMSAMLAGKLEGRSLVLAPPLLLDKSNPGSWKNVFEDFHISAGFESLGKLDQALERGIGKYKNVFIDEAHRFRREDNITYEKLARICYGKRIILVTATPFNNTPLDILSQIKLFQLEKKSSIPNVPNLKWFFDRLEKKIKKINKKENHAEYIKAVKKNSRKIRESVLKYLMVRRTRTEIENYFADDLRNQNVKFPEVKDPQPVYYQFNKTEDEAFRKTAKLISQKLKYARYMPLTYYKKQGQLELEVKSQKNLGVFMRILLVKRLESSFYAFKNSIKRFIKSYELFLKALEAGNVYVSKDYSNKVFELLDGDNEEAVQKLIDEDKAKQYPAEDFTQDLKRDLKSDLEILREIKSLWQGISRDPKLLAFVDLLSKPSAGDDPLTSKSKAQKIKLQLFDQAKEADIQKELGFQNDRAKETDIQKEFGFQNDKTCLTSAKKPFALNKLIVFTESKETAEYLGKELEKKFPNEVLVFTGSSTQQDRDQIIANFDPKAFKPKNDCRILVATDVLSEGVNLHCSNMIVNYDLPWNPTRLMQRVGRINRVDTGFDEIHTFNFFPTEQSNDIIQLEETAKAKITAFIDLLGADARFLTEEEAPESHALFGKLGSKKTITGEDEEEESELKYLKVIKDIRDNDPDLFDKIKHLPKKARTACKYNKRQAALLISGSGYDKLSGKWDSSADKKAGSSPCDQGDKRTGRDETPWTKDQPPLTKRAGELGKPIAQSPPSHRENYLLTYFRKGKLNKFCVAGEGEAQELDFLSSAKLLESDKSALKADLPEDFYSKLEKNKQKFLDLTSEEEQAFSPLGSGQDSGSKLLKILKIIRKDLRPFTEEQEAYFKKVMDRLKEGALTKPTVKTALKAVEKEIAKAKKASGSPKPLKILALLQGNIPDELLKKHLSEQSSGSKDKPREVILSEYLIGEK